jgi:hypothetical protein
MRMIVDSGYLRFSIGSKPRGRPGILHIPKVVSFLEVKGSICEQKILHIKLIWDQTQTPLKESSVFTQNVFVVLTYFHAVMNSHYNRPAL